MDIIAAYREAGTYRGAAEIAGTTHKTVRRVIARQDGGEPVGDVHDLIAGPGGLAVSAHLEVPPPYRPEPGQPVYGVRAGDRAA